ncbi:MAG: hypothetical protein Q4C81_06330 [Kocuria sp.]|nr:hypothetical protein [Kocuria sp.]
MLWWMWVVLWTVLVLISVIFMALLLYRLWRQLSRMLHDVGEYGDSVTTRLDQATTAVTGPDHQQRQPDVYTPWHEARKQYRSGKIERRTARSQRRSARRRAMGQPQRVSDLAR